MKLPLGVKVKKQQPTSRAESAALAAKRGRPKEQSSAPTKRSASEPNSASKSMAAAESRIKEETKKSKHRHKSSSSSSSPEKAAEIEPPRFHRDMTLVCDAFRVSERSRYALRTFDASTLEDFCLMTDEDYADMIVTQARVGRPVPPLQQRKLRVLLTWAQSLAREKMGDVAATGAPPPCPETSASGELGADEARGLHKRSLRKAGCYVPADWEDRFYADLPRLRRELQQMGGEHSPSNWASEFLCLRWVFCGYDK